MENQPRISRYCTVTKRKLKRLFFPLCCFIFLSAALHSTRPNSGHINTLDSIPRSWPNFTLILPAIEPEFKSNQEDLILVVVVNSDATGATHRQLRATIRRTWGNTTTNSPNLHKWKLFFALGVSGNSSEHELNLKEASETRDIMIGNFTDSYYNLLTKTLMSHYWTITNIACKYILKTDDDVYVRVPDLIAWLQETGFPRPFYGGFLNPNLMVSRNPSSKWFITREQYRDDKWPPLCYGAYQVLSTDVVPKIINYTTFTKTHHIDDAFIAVALKSHGVKAVQIPRFDFQNPFRDRTDCELDRAIAIAHQLNTSVMLKYHAFYQRRTSSNTIECLSSTATNNQSSLIFSGMVILYIFLFNSFLICWSTG